MKTANNVRPAGPNSRVLGARSGTARGTLALLRETFGEPTYNASADGKVKAGWIFTTPRGLAEVRDYWWNGPDELSLACAGRKPALWLACYLRAHGIPASSRWYDASAWKGAHATLLATGKGATP